MIGMLVAAALMAGSGSGDLRHEYSSCLNDAVGTAKTAKVEIDGFKDYARKTCATVEDGFKTTLVSFDVKNGMSKTAASKDADVQLDDYVFTAQERYRYAVAPPK